MDKDLRRLVLVGVGLLIALFVGRMLLDAFLGDDTARSRVSRANSALATGSASKRPPSAAMAEAVALRDELEQRVADLVPRLAYVRPEEFAVPSGQSADLHYVEVLRREQAQLVTGSRYLGVSVPADLGMPIPNPTGLEDVLQALRALHVVHIVVVAAVENHVDSVDAIQVTTGRTRVRQDGGFLRTSPVEFELRGTPRAVQATLAATAGGPTYLALDEVSLEVLDEDGGKVRCRFVAATLDIDDESLVVRKGRKG